MDRLVSKLNAKKIKTIFVPSTISPDKREEWVEAHVADGVMCII